MHLQRRFNHNLGLHENANRKQTRLSGKLEEDGGREDGESRTAGGE